MPPLEKDCIVYRGILKNSEKENLDILYFGVQNYFENEAVKKYDIKEDTYYQKIFDAPVKDKTAAGDALIGFYLATILRGAKPKDALMMAVKAASITVSRAGAASSIPMVEECYQFGN